MIVALDNVVKIQTQIAEVTLLEPGIVTVDYFPGSVESIECARKILEACQKLNSGKFWSVIVVLYNLESTSREVRNFYARKSAKMGCKSVALLTETYSSKLFANIFMKFNRPSMPTRAFLDKDVAMEWIMNHQNTNP